MAIENARALVSPVYHNIYGFMQKYNLFGAWERCFVQHTRSIQNYLADRKSVSILYCGTATEKNPKDVLNALDNLSIRAQITTMDLAIKPLSRLDHNIYHPVQTHSASLPFADKSFDYITTDFLLSKMNLADIMQTIQEWSRVLKDNGLITLTAGVKHPHLHTFDRLYDRITKPLYGVNFLSIEVLRQLFYSASLELRIEQTRFDKKPFMYRYPDDLLVFIEANPCKNHEKARKAKMLIDEALFIHHATASEIHLRPLGLEETIQDLMSNNFLIMRTQNNQIFGFIRITDLTEDWSEIGSLYIDPIYRNTHKHYGTDLLQQAIREIKHKNKKAIVFSTNPTVIKTLDKFGAIKLKSLPINLLAPLIKERLGNRETVAKFLWTQLTNRNKKSLYALF